MKPIIGITTFFEKKPKKVYSLVSHNYIKSVELAGGIPVLLPITEDEDSIKELVKRVDGILFSGGEDVAPIRYGESPLKYVDAVSEERDEHELMLFKEAFNADIPILGICRGVQLMNVASGGTLYQDLNFQLNNNIGHSPSDIPVNNLHHFVNIKENSKLYNIFGVGRMAVNSFHHQSVKDVALGYKATALSEDGIIEAIEHQDKGFVLGVQWHPEDLTIRHIEFRKLFEAFVDACKKSR